jgi:MFS transporter, YQGE family, putative transporter
MESRPLSREARVVILINTGLAFSNAVSTVFVSMYLYRWLDGIAALTVFNLGQFALMPLGFYGAALVARRRGNRASLTLGLGLFVAFYGLLVALGESSSRFLVVLGVLNGLANGFFWFPFNIVTARAAEGSDKGRFFGFQAALGSAANAAGPLVSTLAIALAPRPESGYALLFAAVVVVMAGMAALALMLPRDASAAPIEFARHLRPRGAEGRWRFALEASFVYGLRDGANWSVMSILILQGAGSETVAGYLAVGFAVLGIAANYAAGKAMRPSRYSGFWLAGSAAAMASALAISIWPSLIGALASGALWKLAEALVLLPFNAAFFGVLAHYMRIEGSVAGRNIAAEIVLNAGRAIGAGSFLALSAFTADYARILFPALTLAVPATWLIYRRHAAVLLEP